MEVGVHKKKFVLAAKFELLSNNSITVIVVE